MAHPITRTSWIDDDGTGTTGTIINNAEKQTLYNQIDAAIIPTYGTWTPADGSGAGLVLAPPTNGSYAKYGRLVFLWAQVIYPTTSHGANAKVSGLPHAVRSSVGAWQGYGTIKIMYMPIDGTEVQFYNATSGAQLTNAGMTGANIVFSAIYLTD
jgi:hypothetical protein